LGSFFLINVNRQLDQVRQVDADRPNVDYRHDQCGLPTWQMSPHPA